VLELPEGRWHDVFTDETLNGGEIAVAKLLHGFPVALLCQEGISCYPYAKDTGISEGKIID
jgi:hypothetical protein